MDTLSISVALAESLKSCNGLWKKGGSIKKKSEDGSFTGVVPFPSPRVE